jgi:hypothetical protein
MTTCPTPRFHPARPASARAVHGPDWPARLVYSLMFLAAVAMLSLPQAREASATFGWLPFWLAGLPATAWLALAAARRRTGGWARPSARVRRRALC